MGRVTGWVVRPSSKQRPKGFLYPSLLQQLQGTWFSFWKLLGAFLFQQWSLGCFKACNTQIMHIWGLMSPSSKAFPALSISAFGIIFLPSTQHYLPLQCAFICQSLEGEPPEGRNLFYLCYLLGLVQGLALLPFVVRMDGWICVVYNDKWSRMISE